MLQLSIIFYLISLICQLGAMLLSIRLISKTSSLYRWAWISLALGLALMLGRRVSPLVKIYTSDQYNISDAILSVPISALLLLAMIGIGKIISQVNSSNELLQTLTQLDSLTQCFSRNEIFYRINEEIKRSRRNNHSFALLEMDIDHFKNVNDQYGHQVGDEILISLVRHTKDTLRTIDAVGRIGGEEFLILLPESDAKQAVEVAERIRAQIASASHLTSAPSEVKITISIGVTIFHPNNSPQITVEAASTGLIKEADSAMYKAKNTGRNRVTLWDLSSK